MSNKINAILFSKDNSKNNDSDKNTKTEKVMFSKFKPYVLTHGIGMFINGSIFNPPFFKNIIVGKSYSIHPEKIKELYNCVLVNGLFIIPKKYFESFKDLNNKTEEYHDYIIILKTHNYIFKTKRLLDSLIIGVQKGSTTSTLINLAKHDDISAYAEEIHFIDLFWGKGFNFLKSHIDYTKKVTMIKNPDLFYANHTHWMLQQINPFMKFILILRNPIDRAYSAWKMYEDNKWLDTTFEEEIEIEIQYRINEPKNYHTSSRHFLQKGLYYKQLCELMKYFPKQNIKIFILEKFSDDMKKEYREMFEFLDLKPHDFEYTKERVNNYEKKIGEKFKKKLIDFFKEDVKKLEKFLGIKTNWLN